MAMLLLFQLEPGQRSFRLKEWAAAERQFAEAVRKEPANAGAHKWLGMTYAAQEKYLQAEPSFRRACELKDSDACYYLGRTLYSLSHFDQALDAFGKVKPATGRVLLGQALAHEALNHEDDAERLFKSAIAAGEQQAPLDYERFRKKKAVTSEPVTAVAFERQTLPFTVRNGGRGQKRLKETMIAGLAVFDYNGDGWDDIFISNGEGPNGLLRNNRDGSFTDVAHEARVAGPGWSMGVAAADYDNDGHADLFVTGVRSSKLYRNRGDGTFEDIPFPPSGLWSVAAVWVDYDNDGKLDLFEVRYVAYDEAKEIYCGTSKLRQYCHPRHYEPLANALYRNLGGGKFADVSAETGIARYRGKGMGAALGDADGDGRLDLFVANDTVPNFLLHQTPDRQYEDIAAKAGVAYGENGQALSSMGAEFRDFDNDGREDLFVTALSNEAFPLWLNASGGLFRDITLESGVGKSSLPWTGWSNSVVDLNNDGWKDFFTANGHVMDNAELTSGRQSRQPNQVYLNRRRSFQAVELPGSAMHRGAAWGDFDRDGRIDIVVTRLNERAMILWNRTQESAHWIAFDLSGTRSNRDGIGAMVEIQTAGGRQWNRRTAASGYGCSPSKLVHFGLGKATHVNSAIIRWPSGLVQTIENLVGGRVVKVTEE
jgi:tetratricopeptide (TPR) repeat protein